MRPAILLFTIILSCQSIFSQDYKLTDTEKLATTAKIWGFLKYYHPEVANGKYNWDKELFEILAKVRKSESKEELSKLYLDWIKNLGEVKDCKKCRNVNTYQYFDKNHDLQWIDNKRIFTPALSESLRHIERNRHQGRKHYVSSVRGTQQVEITNEDNYQEHFNLGNEDLRLLSLFRYWNIIEYFFPYKYQTDTPWDEVLIKMIPKFLDPESETDYHLTMRELIVSLDDSHGVFITDETNDFFGLKWIPAKFKIVNDSAIITGFYNDSLAKSDDIILGDVITKIDGREIGTIFAERIKYLNGSNLSSKKGNSPYAIFNGSTDVVNIEYYRNGACHNKDISRYLFANFNYVWNNGLEKYKILEGKTGYVNMGVVTNKDVAEMMEALKDTRAIIFDIRNYPNGTLYPITEYISSSRNDFYKVTYPDLDYPGRFIWKDGMRAGSKKSLKYKGEVVLLVNENTQSHAEFTAMCFQTGDNVTTIGSQTSGADGNVSRFEMVGGFNTMISGIGIFYPDYTEAQRIGVKIDIEIKPTKEGLVTGRDEVLEKAIEFLKAKS